MVEIPTSAPTSVRRRIRTARREAWQHLFDDQALQRAWEESGNLSAVCDAIKVCEEAGQVPRWVAKAVFDIVRMIVYPKHRSFHPRAFQRRGRHGRWLTRHKSDIIDFVRWDLVNEARDHGLTSEQAYKFAADYLAPTQAGKGKRATRAGEDVDPAVVDERRLEAIIKSVKRVRKRMRSEPGRYLITRADHYWSELYTPPKDHAAAIVAKYQPRPRAPKDGAPPAGIE